MKSKPFVSVLSLALLMMLSACAEKPAALVPAPSAPVASPIKPYASLQELMEDVVDRSADAVWESSGFVSDRNGLHDRSPKTDSQWLALRGNVITLIEAANLVMVDRYLRGDHSGALIDPQTADNAINQVTAWKPAVDLTSIQVGEVAKAHLG